MSVIDTVKDVAVLIQKLDNIDIVKRVLELQQQVFDLFEENRTLKDDNRALKDRLTTREQLMFKGNAYWKGDDGPFCSRCYDAENLLMRLQLGFLSGARCPKCGNFGEEPEAKPAVPRDVGPGRGGY